MLSKIIDKKYEILGVLTIVSTFTGYYFYIKSKNNKKN